MKTPRRRAPETDYWPVCAQRSVKGLLFFVAVILVGLSLTLRESAGASKNSWDEDLRRHRKLINDFIKWDIGALRGARAKDVPSKFNALNGSDAIPALVAGVEKAAKMRQSCPIMVLASKLSSLLAGCDDPNVVARAERELSKTGKSHWGSYITGIRNVARNRAKMLPKPSKRSKAGKDPSTTTGHMFSGGGSQSLAEVLEQRRIKRLLSKVNGMSTAELLKVVASDDPMMRVAALGAFQRRASGATGRQMLKSRLSSITQALKSPNEEVRIAAAQLLGGLGDRRAVPDLIGLIPDDSKRVRMEAVNALRAITYRRFGPTYDSSEDECRAEAGKWKEWWETKGRVSGDTSL